MLLTPNFKTDEAATLFALRLHLSIALSLEHLFIYFVEASVIKHVCTVEIEL